MAINDPYYEELLQQVTGQKIPFAEKATKFLGSKEGKFGIGSLIAWVALDKLLSANRARAERGIQKTALRSQSELASPENLYYQAALPQAQAEEETARQALFSQILGGVTGPTLARGERLIGG